MPESATQERLQHLVEEIQPRRHPVWTWLRKVVPILVSAAILVYYFRKVEWEAVLQALDQANLWLLVSARLLPLLVFWGFDAFITATLFRWFDRPVRIRDIFWVRGALYLAMLVNVNISNGGMFLYLLRKTRMGITKLAGIQLFRAGISLWSLLAVFSAMVAASVALGFDLAGKIPWRTFAILLGLGWLWLFQAWTYWLRGWRWWPFNYLLRRDWPLWHAFAHASPGHWLKLALYSAPPLVFNLAGLYLCAFAFDIRIPVLEFVILIPLVLFISNLPIAFGGFGTTTIAWQLFFPHYAPADTYLAFTLAFPVLSCLARAVIGLGSLKPAWSEWMRLSEGPAPETPGLSPAGEPVP
jgi:uncharacterized membrane protein YbhN (UPF0104 family)